MVRALAGLSTMTRGLGTVSKRYGTEPRFVNCWDARHRVHQYPSGRMSEGGVPEVTIEESPRERALKALDTTAKVTTALGRPDLARELGLVRARLLDPAFTVLVIGEFKQGKSSLVNALLGADVCPVDDDVATAVPTVLRWGETWEGAVYLAPETIDQDLHELRTVVPVDQIAAYVTEAANPENIKQVRSVELGIPSPLLQGGLVLVDTPGVGGLAGLHAAITLNALPMADAVLFVSDASQEYSLPELEFLATARRLCPHAVGV